MKHNEIHIQDKHNSKKVHSFRFYKDRHVTYNQLIDWKPCYSSYRRVSVEGMSGYGKYMIAAKDSHKVRTKLGLAFKKV
jgi:hypothetical protein